jgi:hypothetical protein
MQIMLGTMRAFPLLPPLLALALAGCNGVPLATQWKLRHFDLGAADVSKIRVALRAPDWTTPTPDKTVIEATRPQDGGERKLVIHLRRAQHAEDAAEIARLGRDPAPLAIYEAAPRDLAAVRAFQEEAAKAKRDGGAGKGERAAGKGEVKTGAGVACRNGAVPEGPIPINVYLHADDETGWLPLLEGYDLRPGVKTEDDRRALDESVPPCGKHAARAEPLINH